MLAGCKPAPQIGPVAAAGLTAWDDAWQADVFAVPAIVEPDGVPAVLPAISSAPASPRRRRSARSGSGPASTGTGSGAPDYTTQIVGGKNPIWNQLGHERMGWALSLFNPATP